jgi:hypothetical protein
MVESSIFITSCKEGLNIIVINYAAIAMLCALMELWWAYSRTLWWNLSSKKWLRVVMMSVRKGDHFTPLALQLAQRLEETQSHLLFSAIIYQPAAALTSWDFPSNNCISAAKCKHSTNGRWHCCDLSCTEMKKMIVQYLQKTLSRIFSFFLPALLLDIFRLLAAF